MVPEVALNPGLGVSPGHKGLHESNVCLHRCPSTCCNLSDPDGLAKLLVQLAGRTLDGAEVLGIGVVVQSVNCIPGSWRVLVQRLRQQEILRVMFLQYHDQSRS